MDRQLAELRRYKSGDAAWLNTRLRAGELSLADIELLSYLGHQAALNLIGSRARRGDLFSWVRGLRAWHEDRGSEAVLRAVLAVSRAVLKEAPAPGRLEERLFLQRLDRGVGSIEYALAKPGAGLAEAMPEFGGFLPSGARAAARVATELGSVEVFLALCRLRKRVIYRAAARTFEIWQRRTLLPQDPRGLIRDALCAWILCA